MELINTTPFLFAPIAGRLNYPKHSLTFIVKATFDLNPNSKAVLSEEQLYPTGDEFYPDDEKQVGSLRYESDFAFAKPHADVLLVGKCFAPHGKPVEVCPVTFKIGDAEKNLVVFGNRYWKKTIINPETTDPVPFTEMDFRYERSFGGADYDLNPVGRGYCKADVTIADNVLPVPNIQDPNDLVTSPFQRKNPVGFGPIKSTWTLRQEKMGSYKGDYSKTRWPWFPEDFDWSYYNAAPLNQQVDGFLNGDESLYFENLHPKYSQYHAELPGIRVRCFTRRFDLENKKKIFEEIDLNLDTLWVDTEAEKLVLVWRGWCPVRDDDYDEIKHVFLMSEPLAQTPASIDECHEIFANERAKLDEEWGLTPEEPEAAESEEGIALEHAEIEAAEPAKEKSESEDVDQQIDPTELESQVNALLTQAGINISSLPEETQAQIKQQQAELINKHTENDPTKRAKLERKVLDAEIKKSLAKLDIDVDNLPPLSEKAKQEQLSLLQEIGVDETNMHADPESEKFWTMMAALFPKIGVDPENLKTFIEQAKPELDKLKKQIGVKPKSPEEKQAEITEAEKRQAEKLALQQRLDNKESLAGEDLSGEDLSGMDFKNADLSGAIFIGANLSGADLSAANLMHANLSAANLSNAQMIETDFRSADLSDTQMTGVNASGANFTAALIKDTNLDAADLTGANLTDANLSNTKLNEIILKSACLNNADLSKTQLTGANFQNATLNDANFEKAQAQNSQWQQAQGKDALFCGADLTNSQFAEADISGSDFSQCTLSNANFQNTILIEASMESVKADNINLCKADLTKLRASEFSNFSNANLSQVIGDGSIWEHAHLNEADFSYAQITNANFTKASLIKTTLYAADMKFSKFLKADLSHAKMTQMSLMQGSLEKAKLTQTDLSGSNLYAVEFLDAHFEETITTGSNLKATKLQEVS